MLNVLILLEGDMGINGLESLGKVTGGLGILLKLSGQMPMMSGAMEIVDQIVKAGL